MDDGNSCTTDACDPATGGVSHTPVSIDDSIDCTDDACDPATGGVSHTPVNSRCEKDGFSCTVPVCSASTGCSENSSNALCSDGASCTTDTCVGAGGAAGTGCTNTPNDILCQPLQVCSTNGCTAAASGDQVGNIIITEFSALGSELIELRNTSALAVDIRGFVFQNLAGQLADIRAKSDVNGTDGTPVTLPAGGHAYGVRNPSSGSIPADAAFVYGDVGTSFSLNDTGDVLSIHSRNGATLQDYVDFRNFITDANAKMAANSFPGFLGVTTQVDPSNASATGNDSGGNWCTTFYPAAPGAKAKVANTAGAPNGNCKVAVLNEILIDPASTDDGYAFVEIVGPGGALVGGLKIEDVEGKGTSAGTLNAEGDINGTDPDGELTLTSGWRIPADGVLIIADGVNVSGSTTSYTPSLVPGLGAGDLTVRDMDLENSGGDSLILVAADGTVWDAVGHDTQGNALDVNLTTFKINNTALRMYESATAITPTDNFSYSLCRDGLSTDSDNNRKDFRTCLNSSPGQANSVGLPTTITSISPNNTLASSATTANVVITGTEFGSGVTVKFGTATATSCTATGTTKLTCTAPANSSVGRVDVTVTNALRAGSGTATATQGFTYTGVLNGSTNPLQADFCNLQFPGSLKVTANTATSLIYGRLFEAGLTEAPGIPSGVFAQVGYGPSASNPTSVTTWRYFDASYNVQVGNDAEYAASFIAPATTGNYSYTYRFSLDNGLNWTYCDLDGAGSNSGLSFNTTQLGMMTVQ
ncbi:hypothetical protein [Cystobacter fuscus]|uniref:hypothetical protein n=1 Tax=Cystobacter fuscus TaxID=43 RepID=UPI0037BEF8A0